MATESKYPDVLITQTNLSGAVGDIDDDPDSPDGNWLTAISTSTDCVCHVSFPTPTGNPTTGAGLQEFRVLYRNNPTGKTADNLSIYLYENGSQVGSVLLSQSDPADSTVYSGTWDASSLGTADGSLVECYITVTADTSPTPQIASGDIGAVEWNVDYTVAPRTSTVSSDVGAADQVVAADNLVSGAAASDIGAADQVIAADLQVSGAASSDIGAADQVVAADAIASGAAASDIGAADQVIAADNLVSGAAASDIGALDQVVAADVQVSATLASDVGALDQVVAAEQVSAAAQRILSVARRAPPSLHAGYARSAAEAASPGLWDDLQLAWLPFLGCKGNVATGSSGGPVVLTRQPDFHLTREVDYSGIKGGLPSYQRSDAGIMHRHNSSIHDTARFTVLIAHYSSLDSATNVFGEYAGSNGGRGASVRRTASDHLLRISDSNGDVIGSTNHPSLSYGNYVFVARVDGTALTTFCRHPDGFNKDTATLSATPDAVPTGIGNLFATNTWHHAYITWNRLLSDAEMVDLANDFTLPFRLRSRAISLPAAVEPVAQRAISVARHAPPSLHSGFAHNAAESANPGLWKGLCAAYSPMLGHSGNELHDLSGRSLDGSMSGTVDWSMSPKGYGLSFTSTEHVVIPNAISGKIQNRNTVAVYWWHNGTDPSAQHTFFDNRLSAGNGIELFVSASGSLTYRVDTGALTTTEYSITGLAAGCYSFVGRWDGANLELFFEGISRDGPSAQTGTATQSATDVRIGNANAGNNPFANGKILQVLFYDRPLSDSEIYSLNDALAPFRLKPRVISYGEVPAPPPAPTQRLIPVARHAPPSLRSGYARSAAESANPELWRNLEHCYLPLSYTGRGFDLVRKNHADNTRTSGDSIVVYKGRFAFSANDDTSHIYTSDSNISDGMTGTGPMTLGWFSASTNTDKSLGVLHWGTSGANGYQCQWSTESGVVWGRFQNTTLYGPSSINNGEWRSVFAVKADSATCSDLASDGMYVDGVPTTFAVGVGGSNTLNWQSSAFTFCGWPGDPFLGEIGSIYLYSRELSENEINLLTADPLAPFRLRPRVISYGEAPPTTQRLIPAIRHAQPSLKSGFARSAAESAHPDLWRGCLGFWSYDLGSNFEITAAAADTGAVIRNLIGPTGDLDEHGAHLFSKHQGAGASGLRVNAASSTHFHRPGLPSGFGRESPSTVFVQAFRTQTISTQEWLCYFNSIDSISYHTIGVLDTGEVRGWVYNGSSAARRDTTATDWFSMVNQPVAICSSKPYGSGTTSGELYIDGAHVTDYSDTTSGQSNNNALGFGRADLGSAQATDFAICAIAVWERELTAAEAQLITTDPLAPFRLRPRIVSIGEAVVSGARTGSISSDIGALDQTVDADVTVSGSASSDIGALDQTVAAQLVAPLSAAISSDIGALDQVVAADLQISSTIASDIGALDQVVAADLQATATIASDIGALDQVVAADAPATAVGIGTIAGVSVDDPIGWWSPSIDEQGNGTTTLTDLAGSNDGTLTNMETPGDWTSDTGNGGVRRLEFDGAEHVSVGTGVLDFDEDSTTFSASAWIKTSTASQRILGTGAVIETSGWWFAVDASNKLEINFSSALQANSGAGTTTVTDGNWHHVALTFNHTTNALLGYVDGNQEITVSVHTGTGNINDTFNIGRASNALYYTGGLDDVRIYDRELTGREIGLIAQQRIPWAGADSTSAASSPLSSTISSDIGALNQVVDADVGVSGSVSSDVGALDQAIDAQLIAVLNASISSDIGSTDQVVAADVQVSSAIASDIGALDQVVAADVVVAGGIASDIGSLDQVVAADVAVAGGIASDIGALDQVVAADVAAAGGIASDIGALDQVVAADAAIAGAISSDIGELDQSLAAEHIRVAALSSDVGATDQVLAADVLVDASISSDIGSLDQAVVADLVGVTSAAISSDVGALDQTVATDVEVAGAVASDIGAADQTLAATLVVSGAVSSDIGALDQTAAATVSYPVLSSAISSDIGTTDQIVAADTLVAGTIASDIGSLDQTVAALVVGAARTASISSDIGTTDQVVAADLIVSGSIASDIGALNQVAAAQVVVNVLYASISSDVGAADQAVAADIAAVGGVSSDIGPADQLAVAVAPASGPIASDIGSLNQYLDTGGPVGGDIASDLAAISQSLASVVAGYPPWPSVEVTVNTNTIRRRSVNAEFAIVANTTPIPEEKDVVSE